jgi:uncharacterized ferredoxin-like protein
MIKPKTAICEFMTSRLYGGFSLPKLQHLNLDNSYFGSTKQISKNLIIDSKVTYNIGIMRFDKLDLTK